MTGSLESELKEIIRERDDIIKDRFDQIIENSIVIDMDKTMSVEKFFELVADSWAVKVNFAPDVLSKLLMDREKESSTAISPSVAIPHIIVDGEKKFDILLVRCKEGIVFSESVPGVHTVFVIVGTKDERNFHLRALAAIAQVVQDPDFEKRWLQAKDSQSLRDIVLLGKRKRD